jgi:sarcosine oxidase, subunit delta
MLHIYCPHCAEYREEEEFRCKGQAHIARPQDPDNCTDEEWGTYMFFRKNPLGQHQELWWHAAGCRKFFNVTRDTRTYEIANSYLLGSTPQAVLELIQEEGAAL